MASFNCSLENRVALVCGASQGMGFATAKVFAELGAKVILVARNKDRLEQRLTELPSNVKHEYLIADFSSQESVQKLIQDLKSKNETIHILVNNAGGPAPGMPTEVASKDYQETLQQHLLTASELSQALIPKMKEDKYGRIINIVSISAKVPTTILAVSSSIRAAVINWSKVLSNEIAQYGITVNNVLPGYTSTERLEEVMKARSQQLNLSEDDIKQSFLDKIPIKRFANPEEVASVIAFLASPMSSYVTGTSVPVDGGFIPTGL